MLLLTRLRKEQRVWVVVGRVSCWNRVLVSHEITQRRLLKSSADTVQQVTHDGAQSTDNNSMIVSILK